LNQPRTRSNRHTSRIASILQPTPPFPFTPAPGLRPHRSSDTAHPTGCSCCSSSIPAPTSTPPDRALNPPVLAPTPRKRRSEFDQRFPGTLRPGDPLPATRTPTVPPGLPHNTPIYVVVRGHRPGYYQAWRGPGQAHSATSGFSRSLHKRCKTRTAADRYWTQHSSSAPPTSYYSSASPTPSDTLVSQHPCPVLPAPGRPADPTTSRPTSFSPRSSDGLAVSSPENPRHLMAVADPSFSDACDDDDDSPAVSSTVRTATGSLHNPSEFDDHVGLSPPSYLVVRSSATRNNRELRGIHFIPGDDPQWQQAVTFLGAGGLEFAFLRDLTAARDFLGDPAALPIVERSPLTPPADSTAHRRLWPMFIPGSPARGRSTTSSPGLNTSITSVPATMDDNDSDGDGASDFATTEDER
jgi:hypothetical protein